MPIAEVKEGAYQATHVDVQLRGDTVVALRRLYDGLHDGRYRLASGRYVVSTQDVIRWVLERVHAAATGRK